MIFVDRPSGSFAVLHTDSSHQVKKLVVNPGMRLSLQSHKYRAEHWFIVSGTGLVQLENELIKVQQGNSVDIPIEANHRIMSTSDDQLVFVEV
jgi:mannose-6-phosphate isomerase-like protein (cupin superfamily)